MERFVFEHSPKDSENSDDKDERNSEEAMNTKLHDSDLFDQDEDKAGEKHDLATGERIDNSTYTGTEDLSVMSEEKMSAQTDDMKGDSADAWLRANDPDWGK